MTTQSPNALHAAPLNKPPHVNAVRINKIPLMIAFIILMSVFVIGYLTLSHHQTKTGAANAAQMNAATIANVEQRQWIDKQSNALPGHALVTRASTTGSSVVTENNQPSTTGLSADSAFQKRRAQALLAAMDSPISAPGTDENQMNMNAAPAPAPAQNAPEVAENPAATGAQLPLSPHQIAKLQKVLGAYDGDPNKQTEKQAFMDSLKSSPVKDYLHESLNKPVSLYEVKAGTLIPAEIMTGVNSDLPGVITAQVRQNVYDTVSGRYLLIPQGSKVMMKYDSQIVYGQKRVLVAAERILFPNGESIDLAGMPGGDISGFAGFHDVVDNHYFKIFGSAIMMAAISGGFQQSQPQQNSVLQNPSATQVGAAALGQQLGQVSTNMISKNLNIQPTIKIRQGYQFNITVTADMVLPRPYQE